MQTETKSKTVAVILAAGRGMRLHPLTETTPKCLLKVGGIPILHRQFAALKVCNVTDVFIAVGYRSDMVNSYVTRFFPEFHVRFIENPRFSRTDTLYSLALAADAVGKRNRVILLNGDVVFDGRILELLLSSDSDLSLVGTRMGKCGEEEMKITLSPDGSISRINKQISSDDAIGEAVGINLFDAGFWEKYSKHLARLKIINSEEYFEYAMEAMIKGGNKIFPLDIGELEAIEIDFPHDLASARKCFSS